MDNFILVKSWYHLRGCSTLTRAAGGSLKVIASLSYSCSRFRISIAKGHLVDTFMNTKETGLLRSIRKKRRGSLVHISASHAAPAAPVR